MNETEKDKVDKFLDSIRMNSISEEYDSDRVWRKAVNKYRWTVAKPYVATILVMAIVSGLYLFLKPSGDILHIADSTQPQNVKLPEGQSVTLFPGSTVSYNEFDFIHNQTISITGEAFINVPEGAGLVVDVGGYSIEVAGTIDFLNYKDFVRLDLDENALAKVVINGKSESLGPLTRIQLQDNKNERFKLNKLEAGSWLFGEYYHTGTPLAIVLEQIALRNGLGLFLNKNVNLEDNFYSGRYLEASGAVANLNEVLSKTDFKGEISGNQLTVSYSKVKTIAYSTTNLHFPYYGIF